MDWVIVINQVIPMMQPQEVQAWGKLSRLYEESYFGLINGNYLVKDIEGIIPQLLKNWLKVCDSSRILVVSAAVLSWEEIFPRSIEAGTIYKAENLLLDLEHSSTSIEDVIVLAKDILAWASKQDLQASETLKWLTTNLTNQDKYQLLLIGTYESGKSTFINTILNEEILPDSQAHLSSLNLMIMMK